MRVLFVGVGDAGRWRTGRLLPTFQQTDIEILRGLRYDVRVLVWSRRALGRLRKTARWADIVYCWHIGLHAFAASFVAARLACVVGGYEFADVPELAYGNLQRPWTRMLTRRVWKRADALLYIDPGLSEEASRAFGHPGMAYQVPPGFDPIWWTPGEERLGDRVLTVADAPDERRIRLKGVDRFFEVARLCPDLPFAIAGNLPSDFRREAPPNVEVLGWLEPMQLRNAYRQSNVYCQLSRREAFGYAICEAMLCGCVPIGTDTGGIPKVIGDAGFVVSPDLDTIARAVRKAVSEERLRAKARERVATRFNLERRREALRDILDRLSSK